MPHSTTLTPFFASFFCSLCAPRCCISYVVLDGRNRRKLRTFAFLSFFSSLLLLFSSLSPLSLLLLRLLLLLLRLLLLCLLSLESSLSDPEVDGSLLLDERCPLSRDLERSRSSLSRLLLRSPRSLLLLLSRRLSSRLSPRSSSSRLELLRSSPSRSRRAGERERRRSEGRSSVRREVVAWERWRSGEGEGGIEWLAGVEGAGRRRVGG